MTDTCGSSPTALEIATSAPVVRRSAKIALVVGVLLMAINHGDNIVMGHMTLASWFKCALTFFVPYCVSTVTAVLSAREAEK